MGLSLTRKLQDLGLRVTRKSLARSDGTSRELTHQEGSAILELSRNLLGPVPATLVRIQKGTELIDSGSEVVELLVNATAE